MTTASAPATPIEHGDPFIRLTKNRIASLSSKNKEILDDLNKLSQKQSQALTAIHSQLETISPHLNGGENHIDELVNGLKFKSRRNSIQQALSSNPRVELTANINNPNQKMQDKNDFMNKTQTILDQDVLSKHTSKPQTIMTTNSTAEATATLRNKESKSDLNGGELDWKYLVEESVNSDSENTNDNPNDKDVVNNLDTIGRRRGKPHSGLSINTKTDRNLNRRLITPESSDSEFDLASTHIAFAPSLLNNNNTQGSEHVRPRSFSDSGTGIGRRHSRSGSLVLMDDVIEEEVATGSLSDAELPEIVNERFVGNGELSLPRSLVQTDSRKRSSTQKLIDDVMHRRNVDDSSYMDLVDDNSSVRSENSFTEELNMLKTRIKKLESQRTAIEIESVNPKRPIRRRRNEEMTSVVSPGGSSQGGASSSTTSSRQSMAAPAQHQKHLQNAFEYFEKAFSGTKQKPNDATPPPTHSMAMVVYSAQQLNHKLRGLLAQNDFDGQSAERTIKDLLKNSDEQIRSLTECLLALPTLIPQRQSLSRQTSVEREYPKHMQSANEPPHVNSRPIRSLSPNPPISQDSHLNIDYNIEHPTQRLSTLLPVDQTSPTHSIYGGSRNSRQNNPSLPMSPRLMPDYGNDAQTSIMRTFDHRELRNRRFSGGSHASFAGTIASSSPSPPPHALPQVNHQYDLNASNSKPFLERRFSHRYSLSSSSNGYTNTAPPSISRTASRATNGHVRSEESSPNPLHNPSPIPLRTTSRNYATRLNGDEFTQNNSVLSRTQSQRIYDRRSQYEVVSPSIERRFTPTLERYERRSSNVEYERGYSGANAYGNHTSEREQMYRNRNSGADYDVTANVAQVLKRSTSSSSSASYRKLMDTSVEPEVEVENNEDGDGETRENANHVDGDSGTLESSEGDENAGSVEGGGENNGFI